LSLEVTFNLKRSISTQKQPFQDDDDEEELLEGEDCHSKGSISGAV
jgi:hypothetical protein